VSRKKKIAGLLQRYQFIDFAKVVAVEPARRKDHLRAYLDRSQKGRWKSYKGLRSLIPEIAGVRRGLDPSDIPDFETICEGLRLRCYPEDLAFNTEAAQVLFEMLREEAAEAYSDHPRGSLRIGPDRTITMGVEHYVVLGEQGVFRWVYPRREPLVGDVSVIVMSLIHHNYVRDDFEGFEVQMIDLSCAQLIGPRGGARLAPKRSPEIVTLAEKEIISRERLNEEADKVYSLLMELAEED
jgi:hypothetical protein